MTPRESQAFHRTLQQLGEQLRAAPGYRLFTVSHILPGRAEVERIFTSMPGPYPIVGSKPMDTSEWTSQMARGECFVANQPQDFGAHFGDMSTILSLGLGSVINVPVFDGRRQLGTLNLLDKPDAYTGDVIGACLAARALARQGFLEYETFASPQTTPPTA
jgi:hypothetical protein